MYTMNVHSTQIVVVGGGLVGLTMALVLSNHDIEVTVFERRTTSSPQPKARRLHMRTMEVFRELGLVDAVVEAAKDLAGHDHMAAGRTLDEAEQLPLWRPAAADGNPIEPSPELPRLLSQDLLEPVLRQAAVTAGATVRFGVEVTEVEQDERGVTVQAAGPVRADYLVAADGARSPIREALGIARSGRGAVGEPNLNVYFTADLGGLVRGKEFNLCQIEHPDASGGLASVDGRYRWVFMTPGTDTDRDWPTLLRTAIGVPVPELHVHSVLPWRPEMLVADQYRKGRVFLAGDAAHVMPPFAAAGANTGIADAHNLGWKLGAVLRGADPQLLASYHTERHQAGWFAAEQSSIRTLNLRDGVPEGAEFAHPYVLSATGPQYRDGALAYREEPAERVTEFAPSGAIGTRIPHHWLPDGRSTVDLAGPGWALAVADDPVRWRNAGIPAARFDTPLLRPGEALLLRPDHVIAWRGTDPDRARRVCSWLLGGRASV